MVALPVLLSALVASFAASADALSSSLTQITANYGANPNGVKMYLYKPTKVATPTPLVVALHYCSGTAQAYFSGTSIAQLADTHGFMVIYPNAPTSGGCWDVATTATLTHNGGGDSISIANVAKYAISNLGVDSSRVFVTGSSSGAMMMSVLLGAYPDIFAAGSGYSGVPYGCFKGSSAWNSQCAQGKLIQTAQVWGDMVRSAYSGYTGKRPRVQFWHGTVDTTLYTQNFYEEIKQWTNVFGVSQTPTSNVTNSPQNGYSRANYGSNIQAILAQGVGHGVPEHEDDTIAWFGLNTLTPGSTGTVPPASTPTTTAKTSTTSVASGGGTVAHYGQCGGQGWSGATACVSPYVCTVSNDFYSQCL